MKFVTFGLQIVEILPHAFHLVAALPNQLLHIARQFLKRSGQIDIQLFHGEQQLLLPPVRSGLAPGLDGAVGQRLAAIGDDEVPVITKDVPEALTFGAGAEGMVERKQQGVQRLEHASATLAAKMGAVGPEPLADDFDVADAFRFLEGDLDGLDQAMAVVRPEHQAIHNDLNPGRAGFGKGGLIMEIHGLLAATQPREAAFHERIHQ